MKYVIATRGSKLALTQAKYVCDRLAKAYPKEEFEIQIVKTKGDLVLDKPLQEIGDKGLFVKEIEEKILKKEADIGVHSMKDMPPFPALGLIFTKAWKREDFRDVLILREKKTLEELPIGAMIGTGSKRREVQLKRFRPDLKVINIRGNVDTRLKKMEEQQLDGIVLAAAGLHRLGMQDKITQYLETEEMISAPAQGVLALEIREGEEQLLEMLNALSDNDTIQTVEVEREFLQKMGGDCHMPVGAVCKKRPDGIFQLQAIFGNKIGSKQAYVTVCGEHPDKLAQEAVSQIYHQMAGTVYLVGGGPGDPSLITVKGLQAIREADCIVYDRLSSPELLEETKSECEKIYVGKENHNHTMRQEEINVLLAQKSIEYEKVVRLKGGDVYVFGRGGEEALFLKEKGIHFEIIPGITSSIAGLAYAGIPITHRGTSLGFHVVTAHDKNDSLANIDFKAMASGTETCVFLMGLSKVAEIAEHLIKAGMSCNTKIAVISCATTPRQRTCVSDLEHIAKDMKQAEIISPALIVVGNVVALREQLNFFENKPLFGKRYLIPKIGETSTRLKKLFLEQGAFVDEIQVGAIQYTEKLFCTDELKNADWLIFTSKNGVEAFFYIFAKSGLDMRSLAKCKIAVIGDKTAKELKNHGLYADLIPESFHSDALIEALQKHLTGKEKIYYLKAKNADNHLKRALEDTCKFKEIVVYENQAVKPDFKKLQPLSKYHGILFTCASSAERLLTAIGKEWDFCNKIYSIGPKTTEFLKSKGIEDVLEAEKSSYEALVELCIMENSDIISSKL